MAIRQPVEVRPVEVITLTPDEYEQAVRASLDDLGLTYAELRDQARMRRFSSLRARKLWLLIGDQNERC